MDCRKSRWLALGAFFLIAGCQTGYKAPAPGTASQAEGRPSLPGLTPYQAQKPSTTENLPRVQPPPVLSVAAGDLFLREALAPDATADQKMANFDKARISYQQAIRNDPNYLPGQMGLARTYVGMNQLEQAKGIYEKMLQIAPRNAVVYHDMAVVYMRSKNGEAALTMLHKALEIDPENRQYQNTLAWTLARLGRDQESFASFSKLYGESVAHYRVALMMKHLQQNDVARRHLQAALALDPDMVKAHELLATLDANAPHPGTPQSAQAGYSPAQPINPIRPATYSPPSGTPVDPGMGEEPQVSKPTAPRPSSPPIEINELPLNRADIPPAPEQPAPVRLLPIPPRSR